MCILLFQAGAVLGQNLESVGTQKALTISGGLNINQIFYGVSGMENRRDPYSYFLSGNLNFDIYGWSVPFSYSFSNQNSSFRQPFNQYALHPTYKWVTGHFGYTSASFSNYTLNGHLFLGTAFDLAPTDKLNISVMYGRLQKEVYPDTANTSIIPAFKRMGYGLKVNYGTPANNIGLILFKAKDDINSLDYVPEEVGVLPQENLVIGLSGSKSFGENFSLSSEFATTAISRDIRTETANPHHNKLLSNMGGAFKARTSSAYYNAFKSSLKYNFNVYALGVTFERIDPGYQTLGAYYFNNDLENITADASAVLFKNKINLSTNIGTQRDNLDGDKISGMKRLSAAFNIAYVASEKLNVGVSYSNFKSFTNIRSQFVEINQLSPYDNLDTLNYRQISQNANVNIGYVLNADENRSSSLNINAIYQTSNDEQGGVEQPTGTHFYNLNTAYNISFGRQLAMAVAFSLNRSEAHLMNTNTFGPTLTMSKLLFDDKVRTSLSSSWNRSYTNNNFTNEIYNFRLSGSYSLKKKHNFNISLVNVNRSRGTDEGRDSFMEFTGTLGYSYNFSK